MRYAFNLKWNELPDDLKQEKIREYMESSDLEYPCEDCGGDGTIASSIPAHQQGGDVVDEETREEACEACGGKGVVPADPDNLHHCEDVEERIEAHFPIYF